MIIKSRISWYQRSKFKVYKSQIKLIRVYSCHSSLAPRWVLFKSLYPNRSIKDNPATKPSIYSHRTVHAPSTHRHSHCRNRFPADLFCLVSSAIVICQFRPDPCEISSDFITFALVGLVQIWFCYIRSVETRFVVSLVDLAWLQFFPRYIGSIFSIGQIIFTLGLLVHSHLLLEVNTLVGVGVLRFWFASLMCIQNMDFYICYILAFWLYIVCVIWNYIKKVVGISAFENSNKEYMPFVIDF